MHDQPGLVRVGADLHLGAAAGQRERARERLSRRPSRARDRVVGEEAEESGAVERRAGREPQGERSPADRVGEARAGRGPRRASARSSVGVAW